MTKRSIGRISFDDELIEGFVKLSPDFLLMGGLEKADILQDIIGLLEDEYENAWKEYLVELGFDPSKPGSKSKLAKTDGGIPHA